MRRQSSPVAVVDTGHLPHLIAIFATGSFRTTSVKIRRTECDGYPGRATFGGKVMTDREMRRGPRAGTIFRDDKFLARTALASCIKLRQI